MLKIAPVQYNSLGLNAQADFKERLEQWLIEKFEGQFNQTEIQSISTLAIEKCRKYEIETEKDTAYIAERMIMEGIEFENLAHNNYVKEILTSHIVVGNEKVYEIYKYELGLNLTGK